jgi:hypothetical protein
MKSLGSFVLCLLVAAQSFASSRIEFSTCDHLNPPAITLETNCDEDEISVDIYWQGNGMIVARDGFLPMTLRRMRNNLSIHTYAEQPLTPQFPVSELDRPGHHVFLGTCVGDGFPAELTIYLGVERIDGIDCYWVRAEDLNRVTP